MTMLCELIDKYVVETLLCSGRGKMDARDMHWEGDIHDEKKCCNSYAFTGIE